MLSYVCACIDEYGQVQQRFRFVPVHVLFLPPISPHAIDKHNFISTRDLLEGFYYFYMGRVAMFTCVCMRVCVGVHVTVFRSAFLFVVRVKEWKT